MENPSKAPLVISGLVLLGILVGIPAVTLATSGLFDTPGCPGRQFTPAESLADAVAQAEASDVVHAQIIDTRTFETSVSLTIEILESADGVPVGPAVETRHVWFSRECKPAIAVPTSTDVIVLIHSVPEGTSTVIDARFGLTEYTPEN